MINFFISVRWSSFHKNIHILPWRRVFLWKKLQKGCCIVRPHLAIIGRIFSCYFDIFVRIFCLILLYDLESTTLSSLMVFRYSWFLTLKFGIVFNLWLHIFMTGRLFRFSIFQFLWFSFFNCTIGEKRYLERVHRVHLFKRLLGVNRSVNNAMIRAELGRYSLLEQMTTVNLS